MKPIMISIVIPTYKRPLLLARCLSAISQQSLNKTDYEIVVVSDGPDEISEDVTRQILAGRCNYKYLSLSEKKGPAAARNYGWQQACGTLIAFTDDDCVPDKIWLQSLVYSFKGEALAAFTGAIVVPIEDKPTDFARNTANLEQAAFVTANCCITREALLLTGGFDERFLMAWREDSDLEFKLLSLGVDIQRITSALVVHPVREAPWGISIKEQRKGIFNALLYKKFPSFYRSKIQAAPAYNYYFIIISFIFCLIGIFLNERSIIILSFLVWLFLMFNFIRRRLAGTSHSFKHISEMILTSVAIPFLSVYWQLYGAVKYRVFFF